MAAGVTIQLKRKAGAFTGTELAAGELGVDTSNDDVYASSDGSTVFQVNAAGAVASVFTRTGAVVAAASDYDASQIDNDSGVSGSFVSDALDALDSGKADASHTHAATDITSGNLAAARFQVNLKAALEAVTQTFNSANTTIDGGTI